VTTVDVDTTKIPSVARGRGTVVVCGRGVTGATPGPPPPAAAARQQALIDGPGGSGGARGDHGGSRAGAPCGWEQRHYHRSRGGGDARSRGDGVARSRGGDDACHVRESARISERSFSGRDGNVVTIVISGATRGGRYAPRRSLPEEDGDEERDGTRRSRETPICEEGRDGARDAASDGESKRTRRRTGLLAVRRRGEATKTTTGGDVGG